MIPKECKRLAEVDFPIAMVSKHAAREKSIRHGHPSTLHLWWARRPLAACRAILLGLLLPDPCDEHCPKDFKVKARELLQKVPGSVGKSDKDLQHALLRFIGDSANWDFSTNLSYLEVSRGLIKAGHAEETPLVVDSFAGGGAIPLEALRLGCDAFSSDLNPVAWLIKKVMFEEIPRYGHQLAEELRQVGDEIRKTVEEELAEIYPSDPDNSKPIAYLWARTIRCESPNCGAEIPLVMSFWLSKKSGRKRALRFKIIKTKNGLPYVEFEVFVPRNNSEVPPGTIARAKVVCPCCHAALTSDRVRTQLREVKGGAGIEFNNRGERVSGIKLLAVVSIREDRPGREYRVATERDYKAVWKASKQMEVMRKQKLPNGLSILPDENLPATNTNCFRLPNYGVRIWADLFMVRQQLLLTQVVDALGKKEVKPAVRALLALVLDKLADKASSHCRWKASAEYMAGNTFSRQALSMVWDFCEAQPFAGTSGGWMEEIEWVSQVVDSLAGLHLSVGQVEQADACASPLPNDACSVWFTDPPYYNAIGYAELSDFFYVWLKRTLPDYIVKNSLEPGSSLTPKKKELIQDENYFDTNGKEKNKIFFEQGMAKAFTDGRRILSDQGIACVFFAHKSTEGWESLLSGLIQGGWVITGSWPIATEMSSRLRARDSAALATSIHLVCRPRPENAETGDWGTVLNLLPKRVADWMERLQSEGIRGADLVFACIGPALEIFSKYSKVETAEGKEVTLAEYLEKVWEVVGRIALEHVLGTAEAKARNGASGALEEDARLTALFLWTMQSTNSQSEEATNDSDEAEEIEDDEEETATQKATKGYSLIYDVARRFAQPLGIHLESWEGRIIETEKGVVRLLGIKERAEQLFGRDGAEAIAADLISSKEPNPQLTLFPESAIEVSAEIRVKGKGTKKQKVNTSSSEEEKRRQEATTLDRVHAAMLFQSTGQANALRKLLKAEQDRGTDFLRLANALSALYPKASEEKRLIDAMLLAVPK